MTRNNEPGPSQRIEEFEKRIRGLWSEIGGDLRAISIRAKDAGLGYIVQRTDGEGECFMSFRELDDKLDNDVKRKLKRLKGA